MTQEIERKFLLSVPLNAVLARYDPVRRIEIEQRYLPDTGGWTTRVRRTVADGVTEHWLTLKQKLTDVSCVELETRVDEAFHDAVAARSGPGLRKLRHELTHDGHLWQVDRFLDPVFDGLVLAEIELAREDEAFARPDWLGREVTDDVDYKNVRLVQRLTAI